MAILWARSCGWRKDGLSHSEFSVERKYMLCACAFAGNLKASLMETSGSEEACTTSSADFNEHFIPFAQSALKGCSLHVHPNRVAQCAHARIQAADKCSCICYVKEGAYFSNRRIANFHQFSPFKNHVAVAQLFQQVSCNYCITLQPM